jgi:hypothetical protein
LYLFLLGRKVSFYDRFFNKLAKKTIFLLIAELQNILAPLFGNFSAYVSLEEQ